MAVCQDPMYYVLALQLAGLCRDKKRKRLGLSSFIRMGWLDRVARYGALDQEVDRAACRRAGLEVAFQDVDIGSQDWGYDLITSGRVLSSTKDPTAASHQGAGV